MVFRMKENLSKKKMMEKRWYLFNAEGKILGRLASEIAKVLRGKHKTEFTPNLDLGDGVIVINAEKVTVTGAKESQKVYKRHSRYAGGLKTVGYLDMKKRYPERIILHAIKGMMPRTKLARKQLKSLRIFSGENHGMEAQKPVEVGS